MWHIKHLLNPTHHLFTLHNQVFSHLSSYSHYTTRFLVICHRIQCSAHFNTTLTRCTSYNTFGKETVLTNNGKYLHKFMQVITRFFLFYYLPCDWLDYFPLVTAQHTVQDHEAIIISNWFENITPSVTARDRRPQQTQIWP